MKKFLNNKNLIFIFIVLLLSIIFILNPNSISIKNKVYTLNQNKYNNINEIPKLAWYPKSHNFGYIQEGNLYNTTFEIWNNGTGILEWILQKKDDWVDINPVSGMSAGEHDLINVTINTKDLSPGYYEGNVYIHSEGDYIYYTFFNVTDRKLAYYPNYFNAGIINQNSNKSIFFEIWNEGEGILNWSLESSSNLIKIIPSNGSSDEEHTFIQLSIKPTNQYSGKYNEMVYIKSNGGNGNIYVNFTINNPPNKPTINGEKIIKKNDAEIYEICSYDPENNNISYFIDWGDNTYKNWSIYFKSGDKFNISKKWNQIGYYTIGVKSKDIYNLESNWSFIEIEVPINKYKLISYRIKSNYLINLLNYINIKI
jgi:hypothetical protein